MKSFATTAFSLSMAAVTAFAAEASRVKIIPHGTPSSQSGSAAYFSGMVRIDAPFQGEAPSRVGGATVTFAPGARTAWHTHPLGQTLLVTQGQGWIQTWGQAVTVMNAGDIVWIPAGVKHWHGATPDVGMTHIAIAEALDGSVVEWLELVSDEQYRR